MAGLPIYSPLEAQGDFHLVDAEDVRMPDGSRLSGFSPVMPVLPGTAVLEPEKFYVFENPVAELTLTLAQADDGKAHEYWFQFVPTEGFTGLTITPAPVWRGEPQYPAGKTCRVGIWMGMAVMAVV